MTSLYVTGSGNAANEPNDKDKGAKIGSLSKLLQFLQRRVQTNQYQQYRRILSVVSLPLLTLFVISYLIYNAVGTVTGTINKHSNFNHHDLDALNAQVDPVHVYAGENSNTLSFLKRGAGQSFNKVSNIRRIIVIPGGGSGSESNSVDGQLGIKYA